ncbi:MAG: hypothetical protein ABI720_09600 [Actinomycetes bacterium]
MTPRVSLDDGQVVTLLVGLGLELVHLHHGDRAYGPLHPAHVRVDGHGRPHLADVPSPPGWTAHDDWVALLRLGRFVGRSERSGVLSWEDAGQREGRELLQWLMQWDTPKPLPR